MKWKQYLDLKSAKLVKIFSEGYFSLWTIIKDILFWDTYCGTWWYLCMSTYFVLINFGIKVQNNERSVILIFFALCINIFVEQKKIHTSLSWLFLLELIIVWLLHNLMSRYIIKRRRDINYILGSGYFPTNISYPSDFVKDTISLLPCPVTTYNLCFLLQLK